MMLKTPQMSCESDRAGLKPLVQYTLNEEWVVLHVIIRESCCIKGNQVKVYSDSPVNMVQKIIEVLSLPLKW